MDIFRVIDYLNDIDDVVSPSAFDEKDKQVSLHILSPEAVKAINAYLILCDKPITNESHCLVLARHYGAII